MAQISYYKLDEIRKRLIGKRFANQLAEINNTLSEKIYDVVSKAIPAEVLEVFNKVEQDHINYVIEYRKNPHISYIAPIYFNTMSSVSSWYSVDANEFMFATPELKGVKCNHTYNIPLPKPLPCTSKDFGRIVLHEIIKKGELFNLFVQMYKTIDARDVLNNKIDCLFKSKRFYPKTLEQEFPEAYEIYVQLYENSQTKCEPVKKQDTNLCDSIENIRATLLSNK